MAYFFSGFNKFNHSFFSYSYVKLVEPLKGLIPNDLFDIIKSLGLIVAALEFFIDFGESNTSALSSFNQDSNTITIQSKMNQSDKDFNFDGDQTVPF